MEEEMELENFGKGNSLFQEDGLMINLSRKNDINSYITRICDIDMDYKDYNYWLINNGQTFT